MSGARDGSGIPLQIPADPPPEWIRYVEEQERRRREREDREKGKNKTSPTGSVIIIEI